jgi:hypothetical protein
MSARKVPLFKKFLEMNGGAAPAVFPIPPGELVKIHYALEHPPVHPEAKISFQSKKALNDALLRSEFSPGGSN